MNPVKSIKNMNENPTSKQQLRTIKSFVQRKGKMTNSQKLGWEYHWEAYGLETKQGFINDDKLFPKKSPLIIEIGFGMGDSLLQMAKKMPEYNFIGIEVHKPGIGAILNNIYKNDLSNLRVFCDDAHDVLKYGIKNSSIHRFQIFFPDPWHKKKHHKRRLIQQSFINLLHQKLEKKGVLHITTDWEHYAEYMVTIINASDGWKNKAETKLFATKPDYRPETKFEKRGKKLGHAIWELLYQKND